MNIWDNIQIALTGLAANMLRSALTMLGIIIGVLAVILGTAIGQGSREQILNRIQSLGSNSITIFPGQMKNGPVGGGQGSSVTLKMSDAEAIRRKCPTVTAVAPQYQGQAQAKYGNANTNTTILCTTPEFLPIRGFSVASGQFFTDSDVRGVSKVCVVGKTTAKALFGEGASPLGRALRIRGINFQIVGLLALKGSAMFGDPDDQIVIPITTGMKQVFGATNLSIIFAQTATANDATKAATEIAVALRKAHRIETGKDDDFSVRTQAEFMQIQNASSQTLTLLLTGIAGVALLVGGIGIMNIMLVSVTERTREIGIRKAIGAQETDILLQFLIEATTLSVLGGVLGIGGFAVCALATAALGFATSIMPFWVMVSFLSSAVIGVFFGIYPAYKAAQLDPIEALRHQ